MRIRTKLPMLTLAAAVLAAATLPANAQLSDPLAKAASWQPVPAEDVKARAMAWLQQKKADQSVRDQAEALWKALPEDPTGAEMLEKLMETFALADKDVAALVELCAKPRSKLLLPKHAWLTDEKTLPLISANARLYLGGWLIGQLMYDEACEQLDGLDPGDVVAPAMLLFSRSVAHYALLDREAGLESLEQLIVATEHSPRRYMAMAISMQIDLETLEDDSLRYISRQMGDIERRLDLGRGGKKVQKVEKDVIESLDKLIKKLEEQQKKGGGGAGQGNIRSNSPAPDSRILGGKGPGEVAKRNLGNQNGWGDLPPKQREAALQQIGREFPSHYRDVIEQYFRRLASEGTR
ncbi:MAG: hypothetical protein HQ567_08710 [Candidatus Nealsonbacteria bacterium]|nr:hypothetical protein [Candidatus Nealsonbacteria bacterium]